MEYTEGRDKSFDVLRDALRQMGQQPAGFNPLTYTVWYQHLAGINPGLSDAMRARLTEGTPVTDDEVLWLYSTYIATPRAVAAERMGAVLASILHDIVRAARSTGADISRFVGALEQRRHQLEQPLEQSMLEAIVAGLIGDTQQMRVLSAELGAQFESNAKDLASLQARLKEAETEAFVDPLTGLHNRRGFEREVRSFLAGAGTLTASALLFFDVDHFKAINDRYGHVLGDKVLRAVASVIQSSVKGRDLAARFGGEEFVVLLPSTTLEGARSLAEQLRAQVERGCVRRAEGEVIDRVTVSIGVACATRDESIESLLQRADAAMYAAKHAGRNRVICANSAG